MALQVRSEMKELSTVERELSVVVPGAEVAKELDRAYRELSGQVRIKGFRQGKVPRYVLEQFYKQDTERKVLDRVVGLSFNEAVKSHAIEPVANPKIEGRVELIPGMDLAYNAKVEIKPSITLNAVKGLKLVRTTYEVTDSDIEKEVTQMRERLAKVSLVEGRDVVQQGDIAECNWSGAVDGEHVKGMSGLSQGIEVGAGTFLYKDAEQALVGKKIGDTFTVNVMLPEDFRVEAVRGKEAVLTFNVLGLKQKVLPALDDEFAKDVDGTIETFAELRTKISDELKKVAERKSADSANNAAVDALIEQNPFEVPQSLVERTAEQLVVDRLSQLPEKQAEMIWQMQGERLKDDAKPRALKQVRISLILEQLSKDAGLAVSDADIETHFEKIAGEMNTTVKAVRGVYQKGRRVDELKSQLLAQRALDSVLASATFEDTKKAVYA